MSETIHLVEGFLLVGRLEAMQLRLRSLFGSSKCKRSVGSNANIGPKSKAFAGAIPTGHSSKAIITISSIEYSHIAASETGT